MFDRGLVTDDMERPKIDITANAIIVLNVNDDGIDARARIADVKTLKRGVVHNSHIGCDSNTVYNAILKQNIFVL